MAGLLGGKWGPNGAYATSSPGTNAPTGPRDEPSTGANTDKKPKRSVHGHGNGRNKGSTGRAPGARSLSERSTYGDPPQWNSPPIEGYGETDPFRVKRQKEEIDALLLARDPSQWEGLFGSALKEPFLPQKTAPSPREETQVAISREENPLIDGYGETFSSRTSLENKPISNMWENPSTPQPTPPTKAKQSHTTELQKPDISRSPSYTAAQRLTQVDQKSRPITTSSSLPCTQARTALATSTPIPTTIAPPSIPIPHATARDTKFRIPLQGPLSDTEFFFLLSKLRGREISPEAWDDAVRQVKDVSFGEEVADNGGGVQAREQNGDDAGRERVEEEDEW